VEDRQDEPNDDLLDRATEALRRAPTPQGPPPEAVARAVEAFLESQVVSLAAEERRIRTMRRIVNVAAAAMMLVALGMFVACVSWIMSWGISSNIAFAAVADALDNLRTATFDITMSVENPMDKKATMSIRMKGLFLAPSRQRMEISEDSDTDKGSISIEDGLTAKTTVLMPEKKTAILVDASKAKKSAAGPSDIFEMVRRLVREGRDGSDVKFESLGGKKIAGRLAVGFRTRTNMADMTLWADRETARPILIEIDMPSPKGHGVMNNFRYDMELDPSLFSLEPPKGYTVQNMDVTTPVEADLVNILRVVAEHNGGVFPAAIGVNKEFLEAIRAAMKPELDKIEKRYGKETPEAMKEAMPLKQKQMRGMIFYMTLKPENDSHYQGGGVKLGTPDRPILWYKPTGAEKYRVIYADLSVKEMNADAAKKLSATEIKKPR
jgi:outer membrane lipoprotein-sorting protein